MLVVCRLKQNNTHTRTHARTHATHACTHVRTHARTHHSLSIASSFPAGDAQTHKTHNYAGNVMYFLMRFIYIFFNKVTMSTSSVSQSPDITNGPLFGYFITRLTVILHIKLYIVYNHLCAHLNFRCHANFAMDEFMSPKHHGPYECTSPSFLPT